MPPQMAKSPQPQTHQRPVGNFSFINRLENKTNLSSALWENMVPKIGALLPKIYQAELGNSAEKDGTTILIQT